MTAVVAAETHAEFAPPTAPARLAEIKVKGAAAITVRLTRISVLNTRAAAVKGDCGDITALQAQLSAHTAGLIALNTTLAAETDITRPGPIPADLHRRSYLRPAEPYAQCSGALWFQRCSDRRAAH